MEVIGFLVACGIRIYLGEKLFGIHTLIEKKLKRKKQSAKEV